MGVRIAPATRGSLLNRRASVAASLCRFESQAPKGRSTAAQANGLGNGGNSLSDGEPSKGVLRGSLFLNHPPNCTSSRLQHQAWGSGVIGSRVFHDSQVIPAKAGIQFVSSTFLEACRVDSRSPASAEDKLHGKDV